MKFVKIRKKIEKRRGSKNPLWKGIIFIKDIFARNFWKNRFMKGFVMPQYKSIYIVVPKVANTSIRNILKKIDEDTFVVPKSKIQKYKKDHFVFSFVRNPYDRIVSCYKDKVRSKKETKNNLVFNEGVWKNFPLKIKKTNKFNEFMRVIKSVPDKKSEEHFKSQHCFLTDKKGNLVPDFVGKFENLDEDFKKACKKAGVENPPELPQRNKSKRKKDYREYYDRETKKLVQERYKKDLELFGYSKDL